METLFGFAQNIITPEPGEVFLDGYGFRSSSAQGVHDDLYVKVCAVRQENETFVIVSLDVCGFGAEIRDLLLGHIAALACIGCDRVALCATHTHASLACGLLGDLPLNFMVWHRIGAIVGKTVSKALEQCRPGLLTATEGNGLNSCSNRRGGAQCDRRVKTLSVWEPAGALLGVIVSACCHPVLRTDMNISADYPAVLTRDAEKLYRGIPFLFLQGCGGDINPCFAQKTDYTAGFTMEDACERLGGELRDSVFGALEKAAGNREKPGKLKVSYASVRVPMWDTPPLTDLEARKKKCREAIACIATIEIKSKRGAAADTIISIPLRNGVRPCANGVGLSGLLTRRSPERLTIQRPFRCSCWRFQGKRRSVFCRSSF